MWVLFAKDVGRVVWCVIGEATIKSLLRRGEPKVSGEICFKWGPRLEDISNPVSETVILHVLSSLRHKGMTTNTEFSDEGADLKLCRV